MKPRIRRYHHVRDHINTLPPGSTLQWDAPKVIGRGEDHWIFLDGLGPPPNCQPHWIPEEAAHAFHISVPTENFDPAHPEDLTQLDLVVNSRTETAINTALRQWIDDHTGRSDLTVARTHLTIASTITRKVAAEFANHTLIGVT